MIQKLFFLSLFLSLSHLSAQNNWQTPDKTKQVKNPLADTSAIIHQGQKIFKSLCQSCHGADGTGNPIMVKTLNPPPANLTTKTVQQQTDGEIFWKITQGRGLMASYKNILSDKERWAVVSYIRNLAKKPIAQILKKSNVNNTIDAFPFSQLINVKTTFIRQTKGFGFGIQHRFGVTKFDKNMLQNFFGLDLAANMRFFFEIPINNKLMLETGRTRYGKFYDIGAKYLIFKQTSDNRKPVSVALYENIAVMTDNMPSYSDQATFDNGDKFEFRFYHRLYYDTQIIISRKFTSNFSAQITGQLVWRNLTPYSLKPKEKSYVIAVPVSMRYKLGLKSALDFEIMPNTQPHNMPISIGYEIASSGNHIFQITLTNSDRILSQNLLFYPTIKYPKDGFMLGFNLVRYF